MIENISCNFPERAMNQIISDLKIELPMIAARFVFIEITKSDQCASRYRLSLSLV
jgi:hypothetical protein